MACVDNGLEIANLVPVGAATCNEIAEGRRRLGRIALDMVKPGLQAVQQVRTPLA